jgi:hypothetical protein
MNKTPAVQTAGRPPPRHLASAALPFAAARSMKTACAFAAFAAEPAQALSAPACSARPYEKDRYHGLGG